jgi:hypothetical protein
MTGGRLIPAGHIGDTDFDSAVYFDFTTVDQKGVPITLAGTPSIAAYENASTTETTANITLSVDHDGKTGTHRVTISSGSSWSVGSTITFRLVGGTVNGVSVTGHYLASCSYLAATARMVVITQSTTDVTNPVTLVDGAITAAKIATDAIDADAIKADAITEIQSGLATSSALATVAGYVDTEVAAILAAVDTEVASIIAAIAALNNITAASVWAVGTRTLTAPTNLSIPSAADIADAVWDEARSGHVTPATFGGSFASIYAGTVTGTSSTTSIVDSGLTQSAADHWKGRIVVFTSGALAKQATDITAFTPASDTLTVTALTGAPQVGDTFEIY